MARANLPSAMQPIHIDLFLTSSDFLLPLIKGVLEPIGKLEKDHEDGHVFMAV